VANDVDQGRGELAAHFFRLSRELVDAELPLLAAHGIGMWDYVILSALKRGDAPTQLELSRITGRDKTRLIRNLDGLEAAGLLSRRTDPGDRRAKSVEITTSGEQVVTSCRAAIRQMEDEFTASVPAGDLRTFRRVLGILDTKFEGASEPVETEGILDDAPGVSKGR
jgi:DNA-binding MarR family transcriptional regulator